ncbi:hypothetical protein BGZ54_006824 [Gamsiella multidivaricata]|nr:hypothetical protein BGZ54_006824 [Gamsiella multidivaricata]
MAVLPYPMNSSAIQPSVNTILNLARGCEQHIVRLYYLPTPNTNGFTTSHTIVSTQDSRYYEATTSRNRSYSMPYRRSNSHEQDAIASEHTCRVHQVTRVSESERGIVHLARLRISTMIIATSSLPYLSHLVSLRLQGNQLKDLPLQIFRLPALRELDVSQNFLTEISPLIGLLAPTLEELFLQSNRLKSLPQQLGRLKQLRLLDIADNHLGCIPVEIQRLVSESLAFERGSLWRLSETALSLGNGLEVQAGGEGSHNPQGPMESLFTTAPGQGAPNITPNEDGGHDDDDYVQIRQGMKCWARGNRFWQVKVPRASAPQSPITATTSMLMAGLGSPSALMASAPLSPTTAANSISPSGQLGEPVPPPSIIPMPSLGSLSLSSEVDRRGYCKDSYTSCSWTLSLGDICSQIVGEKLYNDPHYFCHGDVCPFMTSKKTGVTSIAKKKSPVAEEEDHIDDCTFMMMPEWMIEQMGLHHLSEMRTALHGSAFSHSGEEIEWAERDSVHHEAAGFGSKHGPAESGIDRFDSRSKSGILNPPPPMQLTLEEKEMECEFCSVCQKRLFFAGMRWKGVGVMDERIVPLEWVACSVQCRARAEQGDRRDNEKSGSNNNNNNLSDSVASLESSQEGLSRGSERSSSDYGGPDDAVSQLRLGFQNGINTRVNHESQLFSPALSPATAEPPQDTGLASSTARTGTGASPVVGETMASQRDYRASVLYGLIKSRALRRRVRALSL